MCFLFLVAEAGFEPHDLRVMSPTSYQAAPLRDIMVPEAGVEPVRDYISRDFKSRASANSAIPAFCDLRFPHCLYIITSPARKVNTFFDFFEIFCFLSWHELRNVISYISGFPFYYMLFSSVLFFDDWACENIELENLSVYRSIKPRNLLKTLTFLPLQKTLNSAHLTQYLTKT